MKEITKKLMQIKKEIQTHKLSKGAYAKKANCKTECSPLNEDASCLCFGGAIAKVYNQEGSDCDISEIDSLFNRVTNNQYLCLEGADIALFNDKKSTTKKDVLEVIDAMITLSKFEE